MIWSNIFHITPARSRSRGSDFSSLLRAPLTSDRHEKAFQLSGGVFLCFHQWCWCGTWKLQDRFYWDEKESWGIVWSLLTAQPVLHLIWFWYSSSVMLIPSIWWIFFMFFWFKYPFYLFWFSISLLVNAYRHQIPQWATSELPGSVLLFKLTMGELHCWLNPSSSWVELLAEHSRYWERRFLFISRWKLCSLSQFAQHIHHPGLSGCTSEGHIWSGGDWFRWFSAVFCCSTSAFFSRGLLGSCPFGFHSLAQRLSWFPSKPLSFFFI